jgi:hypothetical protein
MTTMVQRAGSLGGHRICGLGPDGNPGGGAVFDMRRMLSPTTSLGPSLRSIRKHRQRCVGRGLFIRYSPPAGL